MRSINKLPKPNILEINEARWTSEILAAEASGKIPESLKYKYRNPEIKKQLLNETFNKCVYCESKVVHNCPGDIEHILPSSKNRHLHFNWDNLTISCTECNRRKLTYDDKQSPFLNPYIDPIEDMLYAIGPMIRQKPGNERAEISINVLKLNDRMDLVERKMHRLKDISTLFERWYSITNPALKRVLEKQLIDECEKDKEYSLAVKYLVDSLFSRAAQQSKLSSIKTS